MDFPEKIGGKMTNSQTESFRKCFSGGRFQVKSTKNRILAGDLGIITKEKVQNRVVDLVLLFVVDLTMLQTEESKRTTM